MECKTRLTAAAAKRRRHIGMLFGLLTGLIVRQAAGDVQRQVSGGLAEPGRQFLAAE